MANFCPKCGKKINPGDMFCQHCGADLTESIETPSTPVQSPPPAPLKRSEPPAGVQVVKAIIQIVLVSLFLYWVWYSYNCAVGNYPNTGDQMCKSIYQFFSSSRGGGSGGTTGGGGTKISIGCQHCSSGFCWTGTKCCPSSAQFYCNGYCYRTSSEAYEAGCHQSSWIRYCCP